jgi:hypothetical protein
MFPPQAKPEVVLKNTHSQRRLVQMLEILNNFLSALTLTFSLNSSYLTQMQVAQAHDFSYTI